MNRADRVSGLGLVTCPGAAEHVVSSSGFSPSKEERHRSVAGAESSTPWSSVWLGRSLRRPGQNAACDNAVVSDRRLTGASEDSSPGHTLQRFRTPMTLDRPYAILLSRGLQPG